jgi:hypothetical protein
MSEMIEIILDDMGWKDYQTEKWDVTEVVLDIMMIIATIAVVLAITYLK